MTLWPCLELHRPISLVLWNCVTIPLGEFAAGHILFPPRNNDASHQVRMEPCSAPDFCNSALNNAEYLWIEHGCNIWECSCNFAMKNMSLRHFWSLTVTWGKRPQSQQKLGHSAGLTLVLPQFAKLVNKTSITMVDGWYIYTYLYLYGL